MESKDDDIVNENFTIGIIGSEPTVPLKNITFVEADLENISRNIDALFVMEETFDTTLDTRYVDTYKSLGCPIFFIGLNQTLNGYIDLKQEIHKSLSSQAILQYYYHKPIGINNFGAIVPPNDSYTEEQMYQDILRIIVEIRNSSF
jgi:hypothetical protein